MSEHIAEDVADLGSYDGWRHNTRTIREWVRGGCVSTEVLLAELRLWADEIGARNDGSVSDT